MKYCKTALLSAAVLAASIGAGAMGQQVQHKQPEQQTEPKQPAPRPLPEATPEKLPRWRGFNLLEKFNVHRNEPFREEDFRMISELGFNFVRLPMDYRCWIVDGNWERFNETCLKQIDQAVAWGKKYGIHVMICFHRAPGYTVARPPEPTSLWTDPETQRVCAEHWAMFARRYRGIPNRQLSFDLVNEPSHVDAKTYLHVVAILVKAIRAEDPNRLIVSDAFFGSSAELGKGLSRLKVAFSPHQYWPMQVTHYQASWVGGAGDWPVPTWPLLSAAGTLYSPSKSKNEGLPGVPLRVHGPFGASARLRLRVLRVSSHAELTVSADGKEIWRKVFAPGAGKGEWKESTFVQKWHLFQAVYDRDYTVPIPDGTRELTVANASGDWLTLGELGIRHGDADTPEQVLRFTASWGQPAADVRYAPDAPDGPFIGASRLDINSIRKHIQDWQAVEKCGVGVHIGEFGVFNKTPHDVALRWMADTLKVFKEAGWGWALWNFRGSFGVLDSGRADVKYEDFHGHKLDRQMLDLLQRY